MQRSVYFENGRFFVFSLERLKELLERRYRYEPITHKGLVLSLSGECEPTRATLYAPAYADVVQALCLVTDKDDVKAVTNLVLDRWGLEFLGASIADATGRLSFWAYAPLELPLVYGFSLGKPHFALVYKLSPEATDARKAAEELAKLVSEKQKPLVATSASSFSELLKAVKEGAFAQKAFEYALRSGLGELAKRLPGAYEANGLQAENSDVPETPPLPKELEEALKKVSALADPEKLTASYEAADLEADVDASELQPEDAE